jgi:hypothetical protein
MAAVRMPEPAARETDPAVLPEREARRLAVAPLASGGPLVELTPADAAPERLRAAVPQGGVVTAFETIEHLEDFAETVEALIELSAEREATVVLAVPNHAFAPAAEGTRTSWDEGAFAELRSLLPAGHVVLHQLALRGSAVAGADAPAGERSVVVEVDPATAPVAFLAAFGPRAGDLGASACVAQADLVAERAARARLQAELELLRARVAALEVRAA